MEGLAAADAMILFRSTVKAVCARLGLHATFMCWPALPNFFPSGSHLHQSLLEIESGRNVFADDRVLLSQTGRRFVAGLLDHARAMAVFGDPTTNAYARFRPYSFAPGPHLLGRGQPRRADPRPGRPGRRRHARREPALASRPRTPTSGLPRTSRRASTASTAAPIRLTPSMATRMWPTRRSFRSRSPRRSTISMRSAFYRTAFGDALVDYLVMMKRAELERYDEAAGDGEDGSGRSDWEMREYFELY